VLSDSLTRIDTKTRVETRRAELTINYGSACSGDGPHATGLLEEAEAAQGARREDVAEEGEEDRWKKIGATRWNTLMAIIT